MAEKETDLQRAKAKQNADHAHQDAAKKAFQGQPGTHGVDVARGVTQEEAQLEAEDQAKQAFQAAPGTHGVDVSRGVAKEKADLQAQKKKDILGRKLGSGK